MCVVIQHALVSPTNDEYEYLLETIRERVEEGQGETIYELGTGGLCTLMFLMNVDNLGIGVL